MLYIFDYLCGIYNRLNKYILGKSTFLVKITILRNKNYYLLQLWSHWLWNHLAEPSSCPKVQLRHHIPNKNETLVLLRVYQLNPQLLPSTVYNLYTQQTFPTLSLSHRRKNLFSTAENSFFFSWNYNMQAWGWTKSSYEAGLSWPRGRFRWGHCMSHNLLPNIESIMTNWRWAKSWIFFFWDFFRQDRLIKLNFTSFCFTCTCL